MTAAQSWLAQIVSYQPLSFWGAHWKLPVGGLVGAGHISKESRVLFSAWTEAIKRETDAGFITELFTVLFSHEKNEKKKGAETALLLHTVVRDFTYPWTDDMTDAFVHGLDTYLAAGSQRPPPETRQLLQWAMYRMPTIHRDRIVDALHGLSTDKGWSDLVDNVALTLSFRHDMLNTIWHDSTSPVSPDSDDLPYSPDISGAAP